MNDMASIRKMRPLPWAATRCLLGGEVPGEPVAATSSFDVDCFFGDNAQVYQGVRLPFNDSERRDSAEPKIKIGLKTRGPDGLFTSRTTCRGSFRCNVERLENYDQRKPNARMQHVNQKIFPIDIVDVAIVGIGPTHRPGFDKLEPIAAVLKPRTTLHDDGLRYVDVMRLTETGTELLIGNALRGAIAVVFASRN